MCAVSVPRLTIFQRYLVSGKTGYRVNNDNAYSIDVRVSQNSSLFLICCIFSF